MKDYYAILDIDENATKEEIKHAYRELAKKYHPDMIKDESSRKEASARMADINEAYEQIVEKGYTKHKTASRDEYSRTKTSYKEESTRYNTTYKEAPPKSSGERKSTNYNNYYSYRENRKNGYDVKDNKYRHEDYESSSKSKSNENSIWDLINDIPPNIRKIALVVLSIFLLSRGGWLLFIIGSIVYNKYIKGKLR